MPPKPKNTREEIAAAAFAIIKEEGLSALTARELGKRLGASAGSIFTVLPSMDHVRSAARELALKEFMDDIADYREYKPPFKRIGMMIVNYGMHHPELFKLLFMQEHAETQGFRRSLFDLGNVYDISLELIQTDYELSLEDAEYMFEYMWTQAFGLGAMCAMRVCTFSEEEVASRLGSSFMSMYMFLRSGKKNAAELMSKQAFEGNIGYGAKELDQTLLNKEGEAHE